MYGEVRARADGYVTVDFLKGQVTNGVVSSCLATAIARWRRPAGFVAPIKSGLRDIE